MDQSETPLRWMPRPPSTYQGAIGHIYMSDKTPMITKSHPLPTPGHDDVETQLVREVLSFW